MSMPGLKEVDIKPWWLPLLVAALISGAIGFLGENYIDQNHYSHENDHSVETRLQNSELAIATLNIAVANISEAQHRTESSVATIEQTQTTMLGKLQSLQDANDAQTAVSQNIKDQFLDLRKQITDNNNEIRNSLNSIFGDMRNSRPPTGH